MRRRILGGLWAAGLCTTAAFGQATTSADAPPAAKFEPTRERDAAGYVVGPPSAGWWNDTVFYQVFVRSFKDSESGSLANDGVGDIRGLISKLDYLNDGDPKTTMDLGVRGMWLMPMHPSPSYHGYDVTDYRGIQAQYGTMEDFRALMRECRKRDIRVILDLVLNHCSNEHPWFKAALDPKSDRHDWFIWSAKDPAYRGPWNQKVWHRTKFSDGSEGYLYGLFSHRMPDLNFANPEVSKEMLDVVKYWITPEDKGGVGIDGYRLDAIRHLIEDGKQQDNTLQTHQWLQTFYSEYKKANPEAVAVGEVWASTEIASSYVGGQMDLAFEFDLAGAMVEAAKTGKAKVVRDAQEKVLKLYPPNQFGRFLTNHDQPRVATQLKGDAGALRVAAMLLLTGPGVPFVYYGEEIGLIGDKPDERIRTPMPWTAPTPEQPAAGFSTAKPWQALADGAATTNVASEAARKDSLLALYRDLIALRNAHPCLAHGHTVQLQSDDPAIYTFLRVLPSQDGQVSAAIVAINVSGKHVPSTAISAKASPLRGPLVGDDMLGGSGLLSRFLPDMKTGAISGITLNKMEARSGRVYILRGAR